MSLTLEAGARAAGIELSWTDAYGQSRQLPEHTLQGLLDALQWPQSCQRGRARKYANIGMLTADMGGSVQVPTPSGQVISAILCDEMGSKHAVRINEHGRFQAPHRHGYYDLHYASSQMRLAVAPPRCFGVADRLAAKHARSWGLSAQVYALRRDGDGGLGDSSAVAALARSLAQAGGHALSLSPMHATKRTAAVYSPYTPSHRGFLDWVYADPAQILGPDAVRDALARAGIVAEWEHAQSANLVDWPLAYALRRMLWQQLHAQFTETPGPLHDDLLTFTERQGEPLRAHARTVAREILQGTRADDPRTLSARALPDTFRAEMEFEIFAQWLAARCWLDTQHLALDAGQRIGLIHDLAVGCDATGSEAWSYRDSMLKGVELGAPPDAFNADGQCWGISTYSPWGLQASGFQHYIDLLRANMARGGGLRIDHILGLCRLWVVPQGASAMHGGYLRYPAEDMLRLLALESWRHQCIVIGEDLGTVPAGMRDQLAARGVLGTDVLLFMRDAAGEFLPPPQWRRDAIATTTTHDLPPLLGWRAALDIEQRAVVQGWPESLRIKQQQERLASVEKLDQALALWRDDHLQASPVLANQACMDYVLDTPAQLVLIPVEDVLGRKEQPNLPGTVHGYPNWRHRLPVTGDATLQSALQRMERKPQRGMPP
ncbi:4-alpha-glucanotransferase [Dyella flava]|uniref:4-alpha-glucanotransferase n=1 Tax=Dyella flava TaxID=1920170 RepID=A0ABS2K2T5_9GAMM|nr:4-alpha-glucanotransferase [Dyella flava]MBM7125067.1 4-alpha-glucanotransferase [Dyella flava]GLQ51940.1 4-alpha-glucanotransferase [Dyella flava]